MTEWIVSSTALILVITALRYILRGKINLRLQYALWSLVLIRLLLPFSFFSSPISVMNAAEEISYVELSATACRNYTANFSPKLPVSNTSATHTSSTA